MNTSLGLDSYEYMVRGGDVDALNYEIHYKGKKINDVVAVIRNKRLEHLNEPIHNPSQDAKQDIRKKLSRENSALGVSVKTPQTEASSNGFCASDVRDLGLNGRDELSTRVLMCRCGHRHELSFDLKPRTYCVEGSQCNCNGFDSVGTSSSNIHSLRPTDNDDPQGKERVGDAGNRPDNIPENDGSPQPVDITSENILARIPDYEKMSNEKWDKIDLIADKQKNAIKIQNLKMEAHGLHCRGLGVKQGMSEILSAVEQIVDETCKGCCGYIELRKELANLRETIEK